MYNLTISVGSDIKDHELEIIRDSFKKFKVQINEDIFRQGFDEVPLIVQFTIVTFSRWKR